MTAYTSNLRAGPPVGYYTIGDTFTDMNGQVWKCTASGWPSMFTPLTAPADIQDSADTTGAPADAVGFVDDATGDTWTLDANDAGDGLAHFVTITYAGVEDLSEIVVTLTGTDSADAELIEEVTLTDGAAVVTSVGKFKTLDTAVPSATIGVEVVDIGWASEQAVPAAALRGQFRIQPTATGDVLLVCVDGDGAGAYEWKVVTIT